MEATKKIIKTIKILANGPLYCVLLVLAGWNCFGGKRRIMTTGSATDKNIEGIINQGSNVLEQPNQNKAYVVPEQRSTMPQAAFRSSNNMSQTVGTAESHGSISTSRLDQLNQNMILGDPKNDSRDGDKVTGLNFQVHNGPLDNVEEKNSMKIKVEPFSSNLEASMQLLNNKTRQDTPLDQNLQPPLKGLDSGLSDELIKLFPAKEDWLGNSSASGLFIRR